MVNGDWGAVRAGAGPGQAESLLVENPAPRVPATESRPAHSRRLKPTPGSDGSASKRREARTPADRPARSRRPAPAAVPRTSRPQPIGVEVGLGLVWAIGTVAAVYAGPVWLALWLAPVAALAAGSTLRSWAGARIGRRTPLVAAASAAAIALGAVAGPWVAIALAIAASAVVVSPALFGQPNGVHRRSTGDEVRQPAGSPASVRVMLMMLGPAVACASAVLARNHGLDQGLVLVGMVCVYDSAAYLIGTGANNAWEGPIAGVASIGALSILVAAVLFAPFRGNSPWILGGMAAVLAPLGPIVARHLTPDRGVRVPALRRLDSLLLLGPAWAVGIALLLRH